MTDTEKKPSAEQFQCSHCITSGDITFSSYQKQQKHSSVKIWVNNLPDGLSESGVKNLFLTVGKPLSISHNLKNRSALVEFLHLNEAELAVRDLHCKPPYHLKVTFFTPKCDKEVKKEKEDQPEGEVWDFSQKEPLPSVQLQETTTEEENVKVNEMVNHVTNIIKNLHYDPSVRFRQKKLDFKTIGRCVSLGRGYVFRRNTDCSIGGLLKFESASENSKVKNEMNYYCENCNALTTKICGHCSTSYCSKVCLISHHRDCGKVSSVKVAQSRQSDSQSDNASSHVPLLQNCTVVISTYFTMRTVCVRRSDEIWEEKFSRLCNDVAAEAFKGDKLKKEPEVGDLVAAKYHEDFCYYRAKVISKCNNKIVVCFIDFGNIEETNVEDLRGLPENLKSVPAFAVKVQLKGVSNESSKKSVNYFNELTADRILLSLVKGKKTNFDKSTGEVVLTEKETKGVVNETVVNLALPSWKKDASVTSKLCVVLNLGWIEQSKLEIGKTLNLIISHFDKKEFLELDVLWVVNPETDEFLHANTQMRLMIREYCEYLKGDFYLPRKNELCLAMEGGEWQRCVNLKSYKSTCYLFFIDDGHSSLVKTSEIRKMIPDFIEIPAQAVCCTLSDDRKLKSDGEVQSKVVKFLEESVGQTIESVTVLRIFGDAYCLSVPEINKMLA